MRLFFNDFDYLYNTLSNIQIVSEDSMSDEKTKTIIFKMKKDDSSLQLIGLNKLITLRVGFDTSKYTLEFDESDNNRFKDGILFVSLYSKELINFLSTYRSMALTRVEGIAFEFNERNMIKCIVYEVEDSDASVSSSSTSEDMGFIGEGMMEIESASEADDDSPSKHYHSQWVFENVPIKNSILPAINIASPDKELEPISKLAMKVYTKHLIPIMDNDMAMFSMMLFIDKKVIVFNNAFTTIMSDMLNENTVFDKIRLNTKVMTFMDKNILDNIADEEDTFEALRIENTDYIYLKWDNNEAFVRYDKNIPVYKTFLEAVSRDHYIKINRLYLRDVLKRLNLVNDSIEFTIDVNNEIVNLRNSKFSQDIEITDKEGMDTIEKLSFKIMPVILNKSIIGDDNEWRDTEPDVMICYNQNDTKNQFITFTGDTKSWVSVIRAKMTVK